MKVSEFWTLLGITEEQSKFFDENISQLTDNQKSLIKIKVESDIAEYEKNFSNAKGRGVASKKENFAKLHFMSINRRIAAFSEINNEYKQKEQEQTAIYDLKIKELKDSMIKQKIKGMELKEKVVCTYCRTAGGVYMKAGKDILKTRVNSIAARAIGLGTNTEKNVIEFLCTNCDMEWKVDN